MTLNLLQQTKIPSEFLQQVIMLRQGTYGKMGLNAGQSLEDTMLGVLTGNPYNFSESFRLWVMSNTSDVAIGITTNNWLTEPIFREETDLVILDAVTSFHHTDTATNVPCKAVRAIPGHSWGRIDTGCTELALSILTCLLPASERFGRVSQIAAGETSEVAWQLMYLLRDEVILPIPQKSSTQIPGALFRTWIEMKLGTTIWATSNRAWDNPDTM